MNVFITSVFIIDVREWDSPLLSKVLVTWLHTVLCSVENEQ